MSSFMKKAVAFVVALALCLGGVPFQKQSAKAADSNYITVLDTSSENPQPSAGAGQIVSKSFMLPSTGDLVIAVYTAAKCSFNYQITDSNGKVVFGPYSVTENSAWETTTAGASVYMIAASDVTTGKFSIDLQFAQSQNYDLVGLLSPTVVTPSLDSTNLVITKGFKDKVSVVNAGGATVTYKSGNPGIASVDSKGNVTAKKKGTTTITVKTSTGYSGTCKVTVKDNVYSRSKISAGSVTYGHFVVDVYKVSYDKKGNLVIKTRLINKRGYTAQYLKNFKITVKNEKGKQIGVYSAKKKTINLRTGKAKEYTFTIKKSKLKMKSTQDLRVMRDPSVSGKYFYKY